MSEPQDPKSPSEGNLDTWDFAGTRRHHFQQGLRMTPVERLHWLEDTVDEMRRLQELARLSRKIEDPERS
jgi:hypothetical protein